MIEDFLLPDLVTELPAAIRLQRLVQVLRETFMCGAVVLLQHDNDALRPVAAVGLVQDALGRRFDLARHPRLAALISRREITRFEADSTLPAPYDGLLDDSPGEPLPVHDCMGVSLHVEGELWGVLTLDALEAGTCDDGARPRRPRLLPLIDGLLRGTRLAQGSRALRMVRAGEQRALPGMKRRGIVGNSQAITRLLDELSIVADSGLTLLITGETGVGKELFAHWLHAHSPRAGKPLLQVNCSALPQSLSGNALFCRL